MTNADNWPKWAEKFFDMASELRPLRLRDLKARTQLGERKARKLYALLREEASESQTPMQDPEAKYEYSPLTDEYVYFLPRRARPLILSGSTVRAIRRDYSNWNGSAATINEVARTHGLPRRELVAVLHVHNMTHDEMPFTDEELLDRDDDSLHDELLALRKQALDATARREGWRILKADALKWRRALEAVIEPMSLAAEKLASTYRPPLRAAWRPPSGAPRGLLVLSPTDLHFGKHGWDGFGAGAYSRAICAERLQSAVARVLSRLPAPPERILVPIGSDWFHVDNSEGKTTAGTPQDMDGVPEQIWEEGQALALDVLNTLRSVAPLDIVIQAGNHDRLLSACLFSVVKAYFRSDEKVRFLGDQGPYQYVSYGQSLIGITHGDGLKSAKDLGPLMAVSQAGAWARAATGQRYWLTGNLHHYAVHEEAGVTVFLLPSLAGSDRWHTRKGYTTARAALQGLLFDEAEGFVGTVSAGF